MLISPPFLPDRAANQTDDAWIDLAMEGGQPGQGGYPVSYSLGWHGGIHLEAPSDGNDRLNVRAIADGTVVYVRRPTQRSHPIPDDHPLNYRGAWTSDGCVVIRHETEIGADANNQPTSVTFYSVIMHLHNILPAVRPSQPIYRKDEIGQAGYIYGEPNKIHIEIVCDDANLARLVGRASGDLNTAADGRVDAVYGEMYFRLPAGTRIYATAPLNNNPVAHRQPPAPTPRAALPAPVPLAETHTTATPLFVGLRYAGGEGLAANRGDATLSTYRENGTPLGTALEENDAEYNLYRTATNISNAYPAAARPAPSAVYELLRFGRVIGPDALAPANVPHWRRIRYDGGEGWANLNATDVTQFSDADFPQWKGWTLIDDSADLDSRCDSPTIKGWLDQDKDGKVDPNEAVSLLANDDIQAKMRRTICKIPTEWEQATVDFRWGWLKEVSEENPAPLSSEDFLRLREHIEALAFWEEARVGISSNHWHFQPREFVRVFRKCYWLSEHELARCIPRNCALGATPWATALARGQNHRIRMSRKFGKYGAITMERKVHFLAQIYIETGLLRTVREGGQGAPNPNLPKAQYYAAFYGRGYMQLTWATNYDGYGVYRGFPNHAGAYVDTRITQISTHVWSDFNSATQQPTYRQWAPRYDPDQLITDDYTCADSGGYYWVSKTFRGTSDITRVNDLGLEPRFVGFVSWLVNGGGNGYAERHGFARYLYSVLGDEPRLTGIETWRYPPLGGALTGTFPPGNPPNTLTIQVNHAQQIP